MPWLFYKSDRDEWRWADVAEDGCTKAESEMCFATRLECVADAKRQGFGREDVSECSAQITTSPMEPQ